MYNLPPQCAINKPLFKKAVFEKFNLKAAERDRFDADISRMVLVARVSSATVPICALQYDEQTKFCIFHTRLQQSAWMTTDVAVITLQGLTLDDVWNNIVATIGGLDAQAEETIEEQIIQREQQEKLLRQIESLEKQCRTEKQTRKKYELHQQIIKLKEVLKDAK